MRDTLAGPVILESYDTTILVPPGCIATSDSYGSVMIDVPEKLIEDAK
jgi:N-methylhydantoinase A